LDGYQQTITYHIPPFALGDVNEDGKVDAKDASKVLVYYSAVSTGAEGGLSEVQMKAANVNGDAKIDAKDASRILVYYAAASTGGDPTWD
ncbi:MAG: dockerin type I domain-containing protein, partial [Ruminococcus sp.]|nr:dockerin type I domain-containing protein [Ruminococcus sp.]